MLIWLKYEKKRIRYSYLLQIDRLIFICFRNLTSVLSSCYPNSQLNKSCRFKYEFKLYNLKVTADIYMRLLVRLIIIRLKFAKTKRNVCIRISH
jgi:hypothetical protein